MVTIEPLENRLRREDHVVRGAPLKNRLEELRHTIKNVIFIEATH